MKKNTFFLFFIAFFGFTACTNEDFAEENLKTQEIDISVNEIAFPNKVKTRTVINGETIDVTDDQTHIFQDDIILTQEQIELIKNNDSIQTRGGILSNAKYKWKDGIVYYSIAPGTAAHTSRMIYQAFVVWESQTNIKFVVRTGHRDYVEFFNGAGCWSYLGKVGGKQQISIDADWAERGNVLHEIGHAIGLLHEHSRGDRDEYINVHYDNIKSGAKSNYDITRMDQYVLNNRLWGSSDGLDYESIMMYGSWGGGNAINSQKPVMTKKNGTTWNADRSALSIIDLQTVTMIYGQKPGGGNIW